MGASTGEGEHKLTVSDYLEAFDLQVKKDYARNPEMLDAILAILGEINGVVDRTMFASSAVITDKKDLHRMEQMLQLRD